MAQFQHQACSDPNEALTFANLQQRLEVLLQMPQNQGKLRGLTPSAAAQKWASQITRGFTSTPTPVPAKGFARLLRGVGPTPPGQQQAKENAFGNWWFEEQLLLKLENRLKVWPIPEHIRKNIVQRRLREGLAVSLDWNPLSELWCLEIPGGEQLTGLYGLTSPQPVISDANDPNYDPTWVLRGGEKQYFFPVVNPFWVHKYR